MPVTTKLIRGIEQDAARRFSRGAQVRGITLATYLERLVDLHDRARALAAAGDGALAAELAELDLETVIG